MAVRAFDISAPSSSRPVMFEPAPLRRRDARKLRQRWAIVGTIALAAPFLVAVITLGVSR